MSKFRAALLSSLFFAANAQANDLGNRFWCSQFNTAESSSVSQKLEAAYNASVNIEALKLIEQSEDGLTRFVETQNGAGMIIDGHNGYIVTAQHVLEGADFVDVFLYDSSAADKKGVQLSARVIGYHASQDIAVLQVLTPEVLPCASFSLEGLASNEAVSFMGKPLGEPFVKRQGRVSNAGEVIRVDSETFIGDSGSGVLNEEGEIIGILKIVLMDAKEGEDGRLYFNPNKPGDTAIAISAKNAVGAINDIISSSEALRDDAPVVAIAP